MPSQISVRPQNSPIYGANQTQSIKVDRGDVLRRVSLELAQQMTCTAANNTVANTLPGDDWGAVQWVTLRANGSDVLWRVQGQHMGMVNFFLSGGKNQQMALNLGQGSGGSANASADTVRYIDFEPLINAKPSDTWLLTQPLTALDLDIQWAASAAAGVNSAATGYTTAPTMNVNGYFSSLGFKSVSNGQGGTTQQPYYPPVGQRVVTYTQVIAGANPTFRFNLDAGRFSYRSLIINATTTASPPVDTAALFSNVRVKSGSQTYYDVTEAALNSETYQRSKRNMVKTSAGVPYLDTPEISASRTLAGWYHIDLCSDGRLNEAIATNNTDQFFMEFNVTSACTINVIAVQLLALSQGNPSGS